MFGRNLWFIGVLVAAIALPYYMSGDSQWTSLRNVWNSMWTDTVDGGPYARPYAGQSPRWPSSNESMPIASGSPAPAIRSLDPAAARHTPHGSPADTSQLNVGQQRNAGNPAAGVATENATGATDAQKQPNDPPQEPNLCGPTTSSISQLLNFDATPAWVMNNWRRVSTRLVEFDLESLRVPIVTGIGPHDLAGSLTYYFGRRQVLQRIAFDGYTGDPAPLTSIMEQKYGLQAEPWLGAGLYLARGGEDRQQLISVLRIRHATVVRSENPRQRFRVEFELNRPDGFGLSSYYQSLLEKDRERNVWQPETEGTADEVDPATKEAAELAEKVISEAESEVPKTNPFPSKSQLPINADRYLPPPY